MLIDVTAFQLAGPEVDEAGFLAADRRVQAEFSYSQKGFLRRTTARGSRGNWLVLTFWASAEDADAADAAAADHPAPRAFDAFVDPASRRSQRFESLD